MNNFSKNILKEGVWVLIGQILVVVGGLVLLAILTEYLVPAEYGELALGLTIAGLVNQVVMGSLGNGISRFYSISAEENNISSFFYACRKLMGYATVIVLAVGLVVIGVLHSIGYSRWLGLVSSAILLSIINGYSAILSGIQNAARQRVSVAIYGGFDACIKVLLALGVIFWMGGGSTEVILSFALSSMVITILQLISIRNLVGPQCQESNVSINWVHQILKFSLPFSSWGIFTWAQLASDRWALQNYTSIEEVGLYAVLFQIGYVPIGMLTGVISSLLGPIFFQFIGNATNENRNRLLHQVSWYLTFAYISLTVIAVIFTYYTHEWLFDLLINPKYHKNSYLLPWMILASGIFSAGQLLCLKLIAEMRSADMISAKIITSIVGVVLNIYGAKLFGIQGVVAALVLFSVSYFFWIVILAQYQVVSSNNKKI